MGCPMSAVAPEPYAPHPAAATGFWLGFLDDPCSPAKASAPSHSAVQALLQRQRDRLPAILQELERYGRKHSHWAWWVFPTDLPGASEPGEPTWVTHETAHRLFQPDAPSADWRAVLEKVCSLVEADGKGVLPRVDHGRVHHFLRFWADVDCSPSWMSRVLRRLGRFEWPPR
mmetsp:Transcript_16237/g.48998  ORF Transcript_16237/g.48998 Transcript_16237/m.48998 type:complete len:172 (+) Transcript_16237:58-573(+)